ncbi:MAG: M20 family metallopeptidase [Anaerolineae bacterium]
MDVVPPGPGWTVPPFQGTVRGDRVYGRGSADMKGAIASLLAALRALADAGWPLTFQPILLFCTDEEGGSYPGIRCLAEQGFVQGHLLCLDGQAKPRRWAGCCGMVDYRCVVLGKGGHSGEPGQAGANAIEAAIPILVALQELKGRVEQRRSAMPAAPWNPVRYVQPRLNVTLIRGGSKSNVIPAECEIWINRRYLPEEDLDAVVAELEEVLQSPGIPLRLNGVMAHLPPVRNPIGPHWPSWEGALAKGFGYRPSDFVLYGSSTSSDMGWVQETGVQEILLGGLSRPENNVHGPDEWVSITDLAALAKALALYLAGWTC